jgi:superfamily II DNA or RNA helicase
MNQFLTNYSEISFLEKLKENLRKCNEFVISVSFIKIAGLRLLTNELESALQRGCKGRLITSTYQNFTDIESLRVFYRLQQQYPLFSCHLDDECFSDSHFSTLGFHCKGYIFRYEDHVEMIVGSSNITRFALLKNIEWDLLMDEPLDSEIYQQVLNEFDYLWSKTYLLNDDVIQHYFRKLNYAIERWDMDYEIDRSDIKPNYMQRNALKELNRYRTMGITRAITICSAGSGKTYLSAFDALNFNPKRLLYVVHESSILSKSLETYKKVFGTQVTMGKFTGSEKDIDRDFLFSTNVSMAKNLDLFPRDTFDYIVIDECHHAVAESYKKIIEYFEPEFLLGLTATPERLDNQDVLSLFDENVPYELRLRDAIINDLIVPFHYYGIRDKLIDYSLNKNAERKMIAELSDTKHCDFICSEIENHRQEGKLKALVFCKNQAHARMMSEAFNERGYHSTYLTGRNTVGERIKAYDELQKDESGTLEILCSIDILNEGVDIPGVNMVVFLRPTESSTIFIQQLGRGLRKYNDKKFVTVLDFIGNSYKRSVQIALALGSLSENLVLEKRLLEDMVKDDFKAIGLSEYGVEIHLDHESQEEIISYLENENFNSKQYLKQDYFNFKKYIDSEDYPKHMDYLNNDCAPDLMKFMSVKYDGKKANCYYLFLREIGEIDDIFSQEQVVFLQTLSKLLPLVRPYEYQVISLLSDGSRSIGTLKEILHCSKDEFDHVIKYMMKDSLIREQDEMYSINVEMNEEFKEHVEDILSYGLTKYDAEYQDTIEPFLLWKSYRMDQVQRKLLKDPKSNQRGTYIYDDKVVIFAALKKDESIEERLNYKDKFITSKLFQWETMNNVSEKEYQALKNSSFAYLFVRKVSEENGIVLPFTYIGKGKLTNPRRQEDNKTYLFDIEMEEELPDYLQYDYQISKVN